MTWCVDHPIRVGCVAVAAIADTQCHAQSTWRTAVLATAEKLPLAVLVQHSCEVYAFFPDGRRISKPALEQQFPGAIDQFNAWIQLQA